MLFIKFIIINSLVLLKRIISHLWNNYKVYRKWGLLLDRSQIIRSVENISIGLRFGISPNCQLFAQGDLGDGTIIIGDNVAMNYNVMINADAGGKIIIGNGVRIGPYTVMRAANHIITRATIPLNNLRAKAVPRNTSRFPSSFTRCFITIPSRPSVATAPKSPTNA